MTTPSSAVPQVAGEVGEVEKVGAREEANGARGGKIRDPLSVFPVVKTLNTNGNPISWELSLMTGTS